MGAWWRMRSEPTRAGRICMNFAGMCFGFAMGIEAGGHLGRDARVGGVSVYQMAMVVGFALVIAGRRTQRPLAGEAR